MKPAICLQPYIPMRAAASESAEMVNQLIFGDTFRIVEEMPRWFRVIRDCDEYEGWVDWKTVTIISERDYQIYTSPNTSSMLLRQPYNIISRNQQGQSVSLHLSWGSRIYNLDDMGISFRMQGIRYDIPNMTYVNPLNATSMSRNACSKYLLQQAQMLVNVPYLWGGCTAFGIDCSGFTQTLFRFIDIKLPRDASKQVLQGDKISYENRICGDLAFFNHGEDDKRVTHVGLCDDQGRILHCSGYLHYDEFKEDGIYNAEGGEKTHHLVCLKRYF